MNPAQIDATPEAGSKADALSQNQPDFSAYRQHNIVTFNSIVLGQKAGPDAPAPNLTIDDKTSISNSVDKTSADKTAPDTTTVAKLHDEGRLLASIPSHIGEGIVASAKDTWQHIGRTTFETTSGLVLGAGFFLLCKNPNAIISAATTWAGRGFLTVAAVDLVARFARPMADTWAHPQHLEEDKKVLGNNVGDAVFNYALAIAGGISGANLGEKYLATTKLGTVLQGFKETEISAEALGKLVNDPASAGQPLGAMARAFGRSGVNLEASGATSAAAGAAGDTAEALPIGASMRIRDMPDGSHIGSTPDGSVMVLTKDGTALWFKNNRSMFGLRNKLDLAKVLHQGGDETDVLTGMYSPTTMASYGRGHTASSAGQTGSKSGGTSRPAFIGKDPATYFDAPPTTADPSPVTEAGVVLGRSADTTYTTTDGTKFVTGKDGTITTVETSGNRAFVDAQGRWKLSLAASPKSSDNLSLHSSSISFNLGAIADRFKAAREGAEVGMTEIMLERAGDIGSSVFEHDVLVHGMPIENKAAEGDGFKHSI